MFKSKFAKWLMIGALVAAVLAIGVASFGVVTVAAQVLDPGDGEGGWSLGRRGPGMRGMMGRGGRIGGQDSGFLAEELGITVEELEAAQESAQEAAIAQAVEDGDLTQEEADQLLAHQALRSYIDPRALMAQVLGITEEQLAEKPMHEWIETQGLDIDTFHEQMQAAHEDALAQAVADGAITQEQADALLSGEFGSLGGGFRGGPSGRTGGARGRGGCPGMGERGQWQSENGPDA